MEFNLQIRLGGPVRTQADIADLLSSRVVSDLLKDRFHPTADLTTGDILATWWMRDDDGTERGSFSIEERGEVSQILALGLHEDDEWDAVEKLRQIREILGLED